MSTGRQLNHSYDDYLRLEESSAVRHEYLAGEVFDMAGGSPEHGALILQVARLLGDGLKGCTPLSSDVRIHISSSGLTTYPDVSFVCEPLQRSLLDRLAVTNPTVLVEVTSPSTEAYDLGEKLNHSKQLPSLEAVVYVSHRRPAIVVVERTSGEAWSATESLPGGIATLARRGVSIGVDQVYAVLAAL